jgi:hypothetical protein
MAGGRVPASGQVSTTQSPMANHAPNTTFYVNKVGSDGWMQARKKDSTVLVPLPKYTKLQRLESKDGRTYFKILDGPSRNQVVSLGDANVGIYIGTKAPQQTLAHIVVTYGKYVPGWVSQARGGQKLDQQMATLEVDGIRVQVTMNSVWDGSFYPIPAGTYTVLVPDAPHDGGMTRFYRRYSSALQFDQVWFPIGYLNNSRYVHVGNLSDGCTTVLDLDHWADIEEALISHRSPDGASVGQLEVKGTPERAR